MVTVYFMNYKKTISLLLFALSFMNVSGQFKYSPSKKDSSVDKRLRISESRTKNNTNSYYRTSDAISFNYDLDLKNAAEADSNIKVVFVRAEELRKKSLKNLRNALISIGISIIAINNEEDLYINDVNYLGAASIIVGLHQYFAALINIEKSKRLYIKARKMAGINTSPNFKQGRLKTEK